MVDPQKPPLPGGSARVRDNVARVRARIDRAARAAGRDPSEVTLIGVTKAVGPVEAGWLLEAGVADLGENRPEDLVAKAADPSLSRARWHLIGTYQRRKVKTTLAAVAVVHSVHSLDLAATISSCAVAAGRRVAALLQVNVSGEATKQGLGAEEALRAWTTLRALPGLDFVGVMTMAPAEASEARCRSVFAAARGVRDRLAASDLPLPHLSMGMSSDYPAAIAEGSTMVRIGTALFELAEPRADS